MELTHGEACGCTLKFNATRHLESFKLCCDHEHRRSKLTPYVGEWFCFGDSTVVPEACTECPILTQCNQTKEGKPC